MSNPILLFDNRFADNDGADFEANTTDTSASFNVLNLIDWRPFTWWKPVIDTGIVTKDCGSPALADYALVYAEPGTYEFHGSTDNFAVSDDTLCSITIASTGIGIAYFNTVSYRYYRMETDGAGSPAEPPAIAIAAIGELFQFPVGMPYGFDPLGRKVKGTVNRSEGGNPLGRVIEFEEWSASLSFPFVSWDWLRDAWLPAWNAHIRSEPFVFVWEPDNYSDEARLVMIKDDFNADHTNHVHATLQFDIVGRI